MRPTVERAKVRYTREEVGDLIALATRLDDVSGDALSGELSPEQVITVASELGISAAAVRRAMAEQDRRTRHGRREARRRVRRQMRFVRHLMAFLAVTLALALIDALNGGGWWFYYVAAVWGVGVALHGLRFVTGKRGPVERYLIDRRVA